MKLTDNVTAIKGVGEKRKKLLENLNVNTIEDLLYVFPRRYEDRRTPVTIMEAPYNQDVILEVTVVSKKFLGRYRKQFMSVIVEDSTASLEMLFFNAKYLAQYFEPGKRLSLFGKISLNKGKCQMSHPEFHPLGSKEDVRGLFPVYPLTEGLSQGQMRTMQQAIRDLAYDVEEWLPEEIVADNNLCSPGYAIEHIHFPISEKSVLEGRYRLIFEELLTLQTGLFYIKSGIRNVEKGAMASKDAKVDDFLSMLPFDLTSGQKRAFNEIQQDLESEKPMNRLVQGDVGSGKTIVAELSMYKMIKSGFQAVMMAPTELLAKQHISTLKKSFEPLGVRCELLSGDVKGKARKALLEELKNGQIDILVGTHALIQPDVEFKNLGLVITDEQHRFGVNQRTTLAEKGDNPNILVMTATPIPRTLAVILYGDLDISIIDTLPEGRKPIRTFLRNEQAREKIYEFVETKIQEGRQAYVVAPLIEESEVIECRSAQEIYEELTLKYPRLRIGLVHGAMKQVEKDSVMADFAKGEIDVLVSTVVIEVGIDVGNATVMVIENSERFGLAQLHQLRGRVGRSSLQSYCILVTGSDSKVAQKRNEIMVSTDDGFTIAEEDLKLRGPGEIFGTRQHGLPELNISDLVRNVDILDKVRPVSIEILKKDPELLLEENRPLKNRIKKMFGERIELKI